MSRWANDLPVVTIQRGANKRVTIVLPYYENPLFLSDQIAHWWTFDLAIRQQLCAVIVDDGSPVPAQLPQTLPFPIRLFRIAVDVPWNWLAARNIGAHHAEDGWLLLTDMDHMVPPATAEALVCGQHDPSVVYAFSRRDYTGERTTPHSASFLMTRAMFWRIGGYDEALSGHYGTDGEYRGRVRAVAPIQVLRDQLVRYEYVVDSSTARYNRKLPADKMAVSNLLRTRTASWRPKTLSFPYQEVGA